MNRRYDKLSFGNLWRKVTFTNSKKNVFSSSKFSIYLSNIQRNALKSSIMKATFYDIGTLLAKKNLFALNIKVSVVHVQLFN